MSVGTKRIAWLWALYLSLAPGLATGANGGGGGKALELYRQAMRHFRSGDYQPAIPLYERSLSLSGHPNNLYYIAECHRRLGDLRRSYQSYLRYAATLPAGERRQTLEAKTAQLRVQRPSSLNISSSKAGVEVVVDGTVVGRTTATPHGDAAFTTEISGGSHSVTLRLASKLVHQRRVFAEFGEPIAIAFAPPVPKRPSHSTLVLEPGSPAAASVLLNGLSRGRTPGTLELAPGRHTLTLKAEGYTSLEQQLVLQPGGRTVLRAALQQRPKPRVRWPGRAVLWGTVVTGALAVAALGGGVGFNAQYNAEPAGSADLETYRAASVSSYVASGLLAVLTGVGVIGLLRYGTGGETSQ